DSLAGWFRYRCSDCRQCGVGSNRAHDERDRRRSLPSLLGRENWKAIWAKRQWMGPTRPDDRLSGEAGHEVHAGIWDPQRDRAGGGGWLGKGSSAFWKTALESLVYTRDFLC